MHSLISFRRSALPLLLSLCGLSAMAQGTTSAISLEPAPAASLASQAVTPGGHPALKDPANFHTFADARTGEAADIERLTLRFAATTKLMKIRSTKDFKVEQGSSCVEGNVYDAERTCTLLVRFTPQGAGHRLGKVTIEHTASATPFYVGLGGNGYAPVVSFTPSIISTVASTYVSSKGVFSGAQNLAVDGGDTIYIADTGNNLVRMIDSSNALTTVSSGTLSAPTGIAVDSFGEVFFSEPAAQLMYEIFDYGSQVQISGSTSTTCTVAAPCNMANAQLYSPTQLSIDNYNQLFFEEGQAGAAFAVVQPFSPQMSRISDPFSYQSSPPSGFAVDAYDNLYTAWTIGSPCQINEQSYSNAANSRAVYSKVAGGRTCGFAGDGGQAKNAEINNQVGQIAFDIAGNMYFTDTLNSRVRRVDYATGIINTIAGNGGTGRGGDNGPATSATLTKPTGVTVDSQGQVYILSGDGSTGATQVLRKLGTVGATGFSNQVKGTSSSAKQVTVANTGNSAMTLTSVQLVGINAGDFSIDATSTSCSLVAGSTLAAGQSCKIGFLFKPSAAGGRSASYVLLNNTVTNSNTISLSGTGTLPAATFKITAPAAGSTVTSGTTVKFSVAVTASGTAPTGTVQFGLDGANYGSAVAVASGAASTNLTGLSTKTHTISATYSGDSNYAAGGPISETLTVAAATVKPKSVVTLAAARNPATACAPIPFSASVSAVAAEGAEAAAAPTGTVVLQEAGRAIASGLLNQGRAAWSVSGLTAGSHTLTASYSGDASHAAAVSAAFKEVVSNAGACSGVAASR